jgi:hypothetical protein
MSTMLASHEILPPHLHKKVLFAATRAAKQVTRGGRGEGERKRRGELLVEVDADDEGSLNASTVTLVDGSSFDFTPSPRHPVSLSPSNGKASGLFSQIKDRLGNAAKVRDLKDELARQLNIPKSNIRAQFHNVEHHRAHLASAFYVSPFEKSRIAFDRWLWAISFRRCGQRGRGTQSIYWARWSIRTRRVSSTQLQRNFSDSSLRRRRQGNGPCALRSSAFHQRVREIIRTDENGQFRLNLDYFRHQAEGVEMTWDQGSPVIGRIFSDEFAQTFGPARQQGTALTDRERDIAASLQLRLEEVGFHVLNHLHDKTGLTDLGLAGGVAYNSVMNGKILLNTPFKRLFIQPRPAIVELRGCLLSDLQRNPEAKSWRRYGGCLHRSRILKH